MGNGTASGRLVITPKQRQHLDTVLHALARKYGVAPCEMTPLADANPQQLLGKLELTALDSGLSLYELIGRMRGNPAWHVG